MFEKYVYQFTHSIDGQELSHELVPSMFDDGVMTERPSTDDPFTIIFKNNGNGNDSSDSGFFIQFKQGELQKRDMFYTTPKIDRSELLDATILTIPMFGYNRLMKMENLRILV